jgi:hypothetical protein
MNYRQRHLLYIFLGVVSIGGGLTLGQDPRASAQSVTNTGGDGWLDITPPPTLDGWTRLPLLAGSALGKAQWRVDPASRTLVCDGEGGHDWLRFDRPLNDFVLRVEWRCSTAGGRSGVYVRNSAEGAIRHEAAIDAAKGGFLSGETLAGGSLKAFDLANQVTQNHLNPPGQWNAYEITCHGTTISLRVNGAVTCVWPEAGLSRGYVGLESDGAPVEFRNLKLKELGSAIAVN